MFVFLFPPIQQLMPCFQFVSAKFASNALSEKIITCLGQVIHLERVPVGHEEQSADSVHADGWNDVKVKVSNIPQEADKVNFRLNSKKIAYITLIDVHYIEVFYFRDSLLIS